MRVDPFGAAVNSVAVDDTFGVAIVAETTTSRDETESAVAHDERT